jgi:hypothetical protein
MTTAHRQARMVGVYLIAARPMVKAQGHIVQVIGLHYAGVQGTLECAVPVDQSRLTGWVREQGSTYPALTGCAAQPLAPLLECSGMME